MDIFLTFRPIWMRLWDCPVLPSCSYQMNKSYLYRNQPLMIKFFRKIRQNLLSEGKTGKYLKYAIGEIVLVVFGILIALQINNWNELQKESVLEKEYLINIKHD